MYKTFILELSEEVAKKSQEVANSHGELLSSFIKREVERIAKLEKGDWVPQTKLENLGLGINRVTLWTHRNAGLLEEGVHYKLDGGNRVFYNVEKIKEYFGENVAGHKEKLAEAQT